MIIKILINESISIWSGHTCLESLGHLSRQRGQLRASLCRWHSRNPNKHKNCNSKTYQRRSPYYWMCDLIIPIIIIIRDFTVKSIGSTHLQIATQWWCSLLWQPLLHWTRLSPSTISSRQMGHCSSSSSSSSSFVLLNTKTRDIYKKRYWRCGHKPHTGFPVISWELSHCY